MRSNRSVFSRRSTPRLGPRVTPAEPSAEPVGSPTVAGANGGALATADAAASPARGATAPHAAATLAAGGNLPSPVVRGRGSVQAPGVAGAKGGDSKANGDSGVKEGDEEEPEQLVLEDMFRKTEAKPSLYWLPLSEEEVGTLLLTRIVLFWGGWAGRYNTSFYRSHLWLFREEVCSLVQTNLLP